MRTYRLAWLTLGVTYLLIVAGGLVHSTGSALACPDWPLCYGEAFPTLSGGILFEHGHRYIGAAVGLLVLVLAMALIRRWPTPERRWGVAAWFAGLGQALVLGRFGIVASRPDGGTPFALLLVAALLGACLVILAVRSGRRTGDWRAVVGLGLGELVLFQATLGGLTVLLKLPTVVSTLHLATSVLILCTLMGLAFALRPGPRLERAAGRRWPLVLMGALLYAQILLGAVVRHTGAGLACNVDWLTCNGALLPSGGPAWLLSAHRWFGILVAIAILVLLRHPHRLARGARLSTATWLSRVVGGVVVLQVLLGLLTVTSYISIPIATLHLAGAALLMVSVVALYLSLGPLGAPGSESRSARATELAEAQGVL